MLLTDAGPVGRDGEGEPRPLTADTLCSMNLWAFQPTIFGLLEAAFADFHAHLDDPLQNEFLLSETVGDLIGQGSARVRLLPMSQSTAGLTYPGDLPPVASTLSYAVAAGDYPDDLGECPVRPPVVPETRLSTTEQPRLDRPRRLRRPRPLRRPRLRPARGLGHRPVLPRWTQPALVAARHLHGRHDVLDRHAEPGDGPGAERRRIRQLDVVGVPDHRHVHDVLLRQALAAFRRVHRHRLL